MKVTLITLNYNGAENTIRLLKSLEAQTDKDFNIIVADNGSQDVQQLRDYTGVAIRLLENGANLGFAGGNNPALQQAFETDGSDWALILNNDTLVDPDFIAVLKEQLLDKNGLVGLPITEIGGHEHTGRAGVIAWCAAELQHTDTPGTDSRYYIIGGALAISQSAYQRLGPIDENYFLYFEDADYSFQAHRLGVPVEFISAPHVQHHGSASTKKLGSPVLLRYHYRNALYFNFKNAPIPYKILAIFWSVFVAIKQIFKILSGNHPVESQAILNGVIDFYAEHMGHISTKIKVGIECESIEGKNPQWGIGKIIMRLLEEISLRPELGEQFEFTLYFKDTVPDFPFLKSSLFKTKTVPVPSVPNRLFPFYYYLLLPIRLWVDRPQVMFWPNYMLPIIAFGKSYVILTEDIYYESHEGSLPFRYRLAYKLFGWWTAHHATRILAISNTSKNNVARLYDIDPDRLVVNHLGIDPIKTDHPKEGEYILYVGQAFPRRHLKETMKAFAQIAPEFPELTFIIIGVDKYSVPTISPLAAEINAELKREVIIHKDYIPQHELEQYYAGAKALVYISDREAFGLPPMEALSVGVPSLITDNPLGRELFGDNAVFVSHPNSIDSIVKALREAMTNSTLREKIKEHGPEITNRYTWKAFTSRFIETITSIAHHD